MIWCIWSLGWPYIEMLFQILWNANISSYCLAGHILKRFSNILKCKYSPSQTHSSSVRCNSFERLTLRPFFQMSFWSFCWPYLGKPFQIFSIINTAPPSDGTLLLLLSVWPRSHFSTWLAMKSFKIFGILNIHLSLSCRNSPETPFRIVTAYQFQKTLCKAIRLFCF